MASVPAGTLTIRILDVSGEEEMTCTHRVDGFWMYTKPVTNRQFRKFVNDNPSWSIEGIDRGLHDGDYLRNWQQPDSQASADDTFPVVNVSWYAAQAYGRWAGARLPTEDEWTHAALGGRQEMYGSSTDYRAVESTRPIGFDPPNMYGLYDMEGNVWEWCTSKYLHGENPNTPVIRVLRGGSWSYAIPGFDKTYDRAGGVPTLCGNFIGFRLVVPTE